MNDDHYFALTYDMLHELIYGYSFQGGGRQWDDDELRLQWQRHRLAILDFYSARATLGAQNVARIWRGDAGREWHRPPHPPWAEGAFPADEHSA
ncbi:MAG TPA: hypothetical protein VK544_08210 [Gemmatimonadaceae bacterium]|nr:hypothetical protein [Gemmatimonadaceae bacterium]